MKRLTYNCIFLAGLVVSMACARGVSLEKDYPLRPVPFNRVKLQDQFWLPRLQIQAETTVPHALRETEPAVERLRLCAAFQKNGGGPLPQPHRFISSDLFKVMEGAAYTLMIRSNPDLEKDMDAIIEIVGAAQQPDGYLYVSHTCGNPYPGEMGQTPYSWIVHSHELYNLGHMYEGAIAYYRATGKDNWLKLAEKSAQHFNRVIFEGDPNYNNGQPILQAPGHQELEIALCKLYRATGKPLYLDMARKFLDMRGVTYRPEGEGTMSPTYAQQHRPVVEQEKAVGHAVRAGYLYASMADVSALTGDLRHARAAERIWHDVVDNGNEKVQRFFMSNPCDSGRIQQKAISQGPLKGVTMISLPGQEVMEDTSRTTTINIIPYYAWNNRGEDSMIIWMPRTQDMAAASIIRTRSRGARAETP